MAYTNDTWRECGIWLNCENGVRYVTANVIGTCAVHSVMYDTVQAWHLTHIPTGRVICADDFKPWVMLIAEALVPDRVALNTESVSRARRIVGEVIGE